MIQSSGILCSHSQVGLTGQENSCCHWNLVVNKFALVDIIYLELQIIMLLSFLLCHFFRQTCEHLRKSEVGLLAQVELAVLIQRIGNRLVYAQNNCFVITSVINDCFEVSKHLIFCMVESI